MFLKFLFPKIFKVDIMIKVHCGDHGVQVQELDIGDIYLNFFDYRAASYHIVVQRVCFELFVQEFLFPLMHFYDLIVISIDIT